MGCAYCSAHACTFALRRGATVEQVASALAGTGLTAPDRAAVDVARALSVVPASLDGEARRTLGRYFSPADEEWIVLSIAMMGWLNKTMDGLGIPLERPTVAEIGTVIAASGWSPGKHLPRDLPASSQPPGADSLRTRLGVIRYAPQAMTLDKRWTRGVPDRWRAIGEFLRAHTGHNFPVLARLRHRRALRAIATMIRDNFAESVVGRAEKLRAGLVYATTVQNAGLAQGLRAAGAIESDGDLPSQRLARAVSPSPAAIDSEVVAASRDLAPAAIVEIVTFIALLQLLHRLECYYAA